MHTTRRRFTQAVAAGAAGLALPAALAAPAGAAPAARSARTPDTAALQAALDDVAVWPAVGVVCAAASEAGLVELAAGRRGADSPAPARPHSVARVASVTKAMTATTAFQEIERGTLHLDSTIGDVLPGLWPGREAVTLGQLLNHTSGMPDAIWVLMAHTSLWDLSLTHVRDVVSRAYTAHELVALARQDGWWFEPGTDWGYSNTGYVVAQLMVEAAAGRPLAELIRERVFRPAGMHRARLEEGTLVRGAELADTAVRPGQSLGFATIDQSVFAGAAAVIATAGDVVRFYQALMQGRLISQSSVETMLTPVGPARAAAYGYGVFQIPDPARPGGVLHGHDGAGFGSTSLAFASRDGSRAAALTVGGRPYWEAGWDQLWTRQLNALRAGLSLPSTPAGPAGRRGPAVAGAAHAALGGTRVG